MRYDDESPPEPPVLKARKGIWELSRSAVEALGFPERVCCYVFPETRDFTAGAVFIAPAPYRGRVGRVLSRPKFTTQVGRMHWLRMGSQGRQIRLVPVRWPGDDVEILVGAWGGGQISDMLAKRWKVEPSGEPATGGDRVCDAENPPLGPGKGGPLNDTSTIASATTTLDRPSSAAGDGAVHDALGAVPLDLPLEDLDPSLSPSARGPAA